MEKDIIKSGFIGLIGRTNVGKSTLVNKILKQKILITSDKVQTTRNRIHCILNTDSSQMIFVDSPGFFKPRNLFQERLNNSADRVIGDVDIIAVVVDAAGGIGRGDRFVFEQISKSKLPKILLLNKIDLIKDEKLKEQREEIADEEIFDDILEVSARTGENIDKFIEVLEKTLPEGPRYYNKDTVCDQSREKIISEAVREKLFNNLSDEIPHSIMVEIDSLKESRTRSGEKLISAECSIYTERNSQKAIIIGKSGSMLKRVGRQARQELEKLFGNKVFLQLWVKVRKNWTKEESFLDRFGY
jgi:GTP-binding protein Era